MRQPPIERRVIKASVLRPTAEQLKVLVQSHGYTQQELFGRLLDWFAALPKPKQVAILAGLSEDELASLGVAKSNEPRGRRRRKKSEP